MFLVEVVQYTVVQYSGLVEVIQCIVVCIVVILFKEGSEERFTGDDRFSRHSTIKTVCNIQCNSILYIRQFSCTLLL